MPGTIQGELMKKLFRYVKTPILMENLKVGDIFSFEYEEGTIYCCESDGRLLTEEQLKQFPDSNAEVVASRLVKDPHFGNEV